MYTLKDAEMKIAENKRMFRKWISECSIDGNGESVEIYHDGKEYIVSIDENNHIFEILRYIYTNTFNSRGREIVQIDYDNPIPKNEYDDFYLDLVCTAVAWRDSRAALDTKLW